jgi:prepilin-type N-terminal cleavage/methylation domain-containing protein
MNILLPHFRLFMHPRKLRAAEGFTLIELMVVVLVIGILAAIAIPVYNGQRNKSKNAIAQSTLRSALAAAKTYYSQGETYSGFTNAVLNQREPTIDSAAPTELRAGKSASDPKKVQISGVSNASVTQITLCNVSKGDGVYCIRDKYCLTDACTPATTQYMLSTNSAATITTVANGTAAGYTASW